jgi:hypothetical protein
MLFLGRAEMKAVMEGGVSRSGVVASNIGGR